MHATAMKHGAAFFDKYGPFQTIVEIGSMEVAGGSLREAARNFVNYLGVDCAPGDGVDIVAQDPYDLPVTKNYADAVVSSSTFEHADFFWLTFLEMCRICKPGGYIYVNAPSNGYVHRHPVDCWRFYPDAGLALTKWASRNGWDLDLIETFIGEPDPDVAKWEDFVAVWRKH